MRKLRTGLFTLSFVAASVVCAMATDNPPLILKFDTVNVPGASQTWIHGINNAGVTVGAYLDKAGVCHGFIRNGKEITKLDDPNGSCTDAYNLNPNGSVAVVGNYYANTGNPRGFLYKNGKFLDIPGPAGATVSMANGINDKGDIVGVYIDSNTVVHGFLLKGGKYKTLDVPGAGFSDATGINNAGDVVLYWVPKGGGPYNSSLYNGKIFTTINVPGAEGSVATALYSVDDVAYFWVDVHAQTHSALRHNGTVFKFDPPKAPGSYAWGINDKHKIGGGYALTNTGNVSGYVATYK
jgi:uncharacterized membrane protein